MSNLDKQHKLLKESYKIMQIKKLMEGLSKESKQKLLKEADNNEMTDNQNSKIPADALKSPSLAVRYASEVPQGQKVPSEIINVISQDPSQAYTYASEVLQGQKVPSEILNAIIKNPMNAHLYASKVLKWRNLPPEIIIGLDKIDSGYAVEYVSKVLKWQNVPQQIIDYIKKKFPNYKIPPNTSIATKTEDK